MSKTRVSPLSKLSIPRLELMSCLILARLMKKVKESLESIVEISNIRYWSDSLTALFWIKGIDKDWKLFIDNRVQEIRRLSEIDSWSHCPGSQNPADLPTRGVQPSKLSATTVWWQGPSWLLENDDVWPTMPTLSCTPDECIEEMKGSSKKESVVTLTASDSVLTSEVLPLNKYSTWNKLRRVTAFVLRFIANCQTKENRVLGEITSDELDSAEILLLKRIQKDIPIQKNKQLEYQLGVFTDEHGVIRCRGRIARADVPYEFKFPALLPRDHHVTELIIRNCHEQVYHDGVNETLAELRARFWIIKGRQKIKHSLRKCNRCRRIQGRSYENSSTSDLPSFRVEDCPAFTSVGIDFAGPLYIRKQNSSNDMRKIYIALFTCATSRAIHLELVDDLETDTFLRCLRRFISRRGIPSLITSDNAKTFKSASKRLTSLFENEKVTNYLSQRKITWKFILPRSPWWGGFYERLVRSVKSCLKKVIGNAKLNYDELHTSIIEIEAVLNSRPLTYLSAVSIGETLTPSHLVIGKRLLSISSINPEKYDQDDDYNCVTKIHRREKYLNSLLQQFRSKWKREYLTSLREQHRHTTKSSNIPDINVGDIVLVMDECKTNRNLWRLSRVESVVKGVDHEIRGATVRLANGNLLSRPLVKLFPLECDTNKDITTTLNETIDSHSYAKPSVPIREGRTTRTAAIVGNARRQLVEDFLEDS